MPTGYTQKLYEGEPQSFPEFALGAARAFGALITMRDDAPGVAIPEVFEPDAGEKAYLDAARLKLEELTKRTNDEWRLAMLAENEEMEAAAAKAADRVDAMRTRYEAMLAEVEAWMPPSSEHEEMKTFMRDQITSSIDFDCGHPITARPVYSVDNYREARLQSARQSLARATAAWGDEVARAEGRTRWVRLLRESLASAPSSSADMGGEVARADALERGGES